ncbi:uncharacterized protein [Zea mays]|uniref:uncharacterized protein n=1 Tax=Zea mays TaxID=4577 RepID=UPI0004DE9232|nr:uncharacterized protein LOC103627311 [Zea mays]XP_008645838.1 uncharacterized protein LOC103627312 [Zea mays]|eukprot:XP_008645835.1 uncharacterized protein LOC103627311 [Zea mays]
MKTGHRFFFPGSLPPRPYKSSFLRHAEPIPAFPLPRYCQLYVCHLRRMPVPRRPPELRRNVPVEFAAPHARRQGLIVPSVVCPSTPAIVFDYPSSSCRDAMLVGGHTVVAPKSLCVCCSAPTTVSPAHRHQSIVTSQSISCSALFVCHPK